MRGAGKASAAAAESSAPARRCHAVATALQPHELGAPCVDASSVGAMAEARSGSLASTDSDANSAVATAAGRLVSMVQGGHEGGGDGSNLPASNNFREMCGANVAALVSRGQRTRRTMRQKPETVALQVTKELREAVESDDAGLRAELFAASSALNACPMLCIRKNDESCGSTAQAAAKSPRISQARWATEICAKCLSRQMR